MEVQWWCETDTFGEVTRYVCHVLPLSSSGSPRSLPQLYQSRIIIEPPLPHAIIHGYWHHWHHGGADDDSRRTWHILTNSVTSPIPVSSQVGCFSCRDLVSGRGGIRWNPLTSPRSHQLQRVSWDETLNSVRVWQFEIPWVIRRKLIHLCSSQQA
jgi:hypothetical protein